jgi:hypothetical protein
MQNDPKDRQRLVRKPPARAGAPFDLGRDVPPLDTPEFRRRLGQIIANATGPVWMRDRPDKPPRRH